jgi:hypothetical protein
VAGRADGGREDDRPGPRDASALAAGSGVTRLPG